jgi:three-Cys-motif partner protein
VSKGTTAGFWGGEDGAAYLKHEILRRYARPWAMKTGSTSPDRRVVVLDGFAGQGVYDDGTLGSAGILLEVARGLGARRVLDGRFVERDAATYAKLSKVVATKGAGLAATAYPGELDDHIDTILAESAGVPLLGFLDPCGVVPPFDRVISIMDREQGQGRGSGTELLLTFMTSGVRRMAGRLDGAPGHGREATLAKLDRVCGGDWWRAEWRRLVRVDREAADDALVDGYADRLAAASAGSVARWTIPVVRREGQRPVYHLIFLTRHEDGIELMGESLSLALSAWRRREVELEYSDTLISPEDVHRDSELRLASAWQTELVANTREVLARQQQFRVAPNYGDVFGGAVGLARMTHLRAALRSMYRDGEILDDPRGDLMAFVVRRAG